MSDKTKVVLLRFVRGVAAVEIPIILAALGNITDITNIQQIKSVAVSVILPLLTGLLLAADKYLRYDDSQPQ